MPVAEAKYTPDQREAVAIARVDLGMRPKDIANAAAAGKLELHGTAIPAFEIPPASIGTYAKRLRDERAGRTTTSTLAGVPHRDAIETLRARLINAADATLAAWERQRPGDRDVERGRQIARLVREAAALPAREDPAPPAPGAKVNGTQHGGQTRGGITGAILADHRATTTEAVPATPPSVQKDTDEDHKPQSPALQDAAQHQHAQEHDAASNANDKTNTPETDPTPGSAVRALAVRAGVVG